MYQGDEKSPKVSHFSLLEWNPDLSSPLSFHIEDGGGSKMVEG